MRREDLEVALRSVPNGAGAGALPRFLDLVDRHDRPWSRTLWDPGHLTASAFVLHPDLDRVALVDHPIIGRPLQPGGHVEDTDCDLESAARREVREELGLADLDGHGVIDLDVHRFPEVEQQPPHLHFDVRYLFVSASGRLRPAPGEAVARWIRTGDLTTVEPTIRRAVAAAGRVLA